jgi:hypothetical protein
MSVDQYVKSVDASLEVTAFARVALV